ncbi:MAG: Ig-like domain-containing protein [Candidatus Omnitrophica bacterium]|jgi:hypothetical protein|nr:Ig-like domain-containing protein [Candidatus Omnitrophota bacterium]
MKVIDHYPTIGATGIYRNQSIQIYFDKPIEATSIDWQTFSLNDSNTFTSVVGDLGPIWASGINLSGVTSGLVFTPSVALLANTEYSVYIYHEPNSVIAKDGDFVRKTYSYSFVTGTGYYSNIIIPGIPTGIVDYSNPDPNTDLYNITNGIYVTKTTPTHQATNFPSASGQIDIFFNIPLTISDSDISGCIDIQITDVLD